MDYNMKRGGGGIFFVDFPHLRNAGLDRHQAKDKGVSTLHVFSSTPFYHTLKEIATYFFGLYVNNRKI